jgi:hypothetical protein
MRITESRLRQLIREALSPEDEEFIQGVIDDLRTLEVAFSVVEGLSDDASADEREEKLEALSDALRGIISYEGEDIEIGRTPEEMAMLKDAGFDPTSIKQLVDYGMAVYKKAEEAQKTQTKPSAESSTHVPAGSTKMPADVRVSGRAGPGGVTTSMFVQLGSGGSYRIEVPNSWDGATVGSTAPALRIGDITYRWVLGGYLGIFKAMIGTNGTHWYLIDDKGLYRLPSLSAAKELADRIKS